jgi:hypothetical protein
MDPADFAKGVQQALSQPGAEPAPVTPAPLHKPHWTSRTDRLGAVRLAPRRGYGTESLFIWVFADGSVVVGDAALSPEATKRLIVMWNAGRGEFEYVAGPNVTVHARWLTFDDGKRGFGLRVYDKLRPVSELLRESCTASEREAHRALKELFALRARSGA